MGRKGKTQKHTRKELDQKVFAAKARNGAVGGGGQGAAARKDAWTKASVHCKECFLIQPSFKTAQIHFENKHPKIAFPAEEYQAMFDEAKGTKKKERENKSKNQTVGAKKGGDKDKKKKKKKKNDFSDLDAALAGM